MIEGHLVLSSISGRYAVGDEDGPNLSSGQRIAIALEDGQWIKGRVEYDGALYAIQGSVMQQMRKASPSVGGYYFESDSGYCCGLCVGMEVWLL